MLDTFGYKFKSRDLLIAIVIASAVLRFWGLGSAEVFHDEGFYAFRSIGYLDYIQNDDQTTPVQWFADSALPAWTNLSFHDHPPLYFLIQHIFFRLFGDSLFVARLPSVLAGIGSIILLFFIIKKLFRSESAGLLAALLLGVNHIHTWISRSAIMESIQIFIILACIYMFLEFCEDRKKWFWFGAALGISFLIKYTSAFLIPVFIVYLLIYDFELLNYARVSSSGLARGSRPSILQKNLDSSESGNDNRKILRSWQLYAALLVTLLMFTPVLIYNFNLYRSIGHFDLQFAYLFRQATTEWRASLGKIQEPFSNISGNMIAMYSIPFLLLVSAGFILGVKKIFFWLRQISHTETKENRAANQKHHVEAILAVSAVIIITLMLLAVGSAYRFIALYVPFFVILSVTFLMWLKNYFNDINIFIPFLAIFIAYELFFTIDGIFLTFPDFGVVKLDQYFDRVFDGQRPLFPPNSSNPHLEKVIQDNLNNYPKSKTPAMLIYDENMGLSARLWVFTRRIYYHGIPAVTTRQFKALLRSNGAATLKDYKIYFVKASQYTSLNPYFPTPDAADLEVFLRQNMGVKPADRITGYQELPMFDVYEFTM